MSRPPSPTLHAAMVGAAFRAVLAASAPETRGKLLGALLSLLPVSLMDEIRAVLRAQHARTGGSGLTDWVKLQPGMFVGGGAHAIRNDYCWVGVAYGNLPRPQIHWEYPRIMGRGFSWLMLKQF